MKPFTCCCEWSFVVGRKRVYGPVYQVGLPGHFSGPRGCMHVGGMMTRAEFEENYSDCAGCHSGEHHHAELSRSHPA
jgi:hypothetical protein